MTTSTYPPSAAMGPPRPASYPVHVDADLDPQLSRWLWLVKWFLAIPHYLVLTLLWAAFAVSSVVAFVGILVSGRYPRGIFDFNVGVLRWSWRVAYYAYGALGTDRYPPFTLDDVPDYPAHLAIDYPEHLSRGLVLVKWWLLAIPHYVVLGLLVGGVGYAARDTEVSGGASAWGSGLIGILVLVAGVVLLVTGRYPQRLFDVVLGLNRWVLRVAGYVGLMTDEYPPFALDQGGHEPGPGGMALLAPAAPGATAPPSDATTGGASGTETASVTAPVTGTATGAGTGTATPSPTPPTSGWTAGRIVSLVAGSLCVLAAVGLAVPAAALAVADHTSRDSGGFLMSSRQTLTTEGNAVSSGSLTLHADGPPSVLPDATLGETKVTVTSPDGRALFVGIAPAAQVESYLRGVHHATITGLSNGRPTFDTTAGGPPPSAPGAQQFWVRSASGPSATVTWPSTNGVWSIVVMNADGSSGVTASTAVGATVPVLGWAIGGLFVFAGLFLLLGLVLVVIPLRAASRSTRAAAPTAPTAPSAPTAPPAPA